VSVSYRQTISDELADAIDARRGLLSRQEYTTQALAAAVAQPTVAELVRQVEQLRSELARTRVAAPAATTAPPLVAELLTF
jgi:hypothetical protein